MADTIFEHLKYQLDQKKDHFLKILGVLAGGIKNLQV
jgi:hypothetical protein